MANNLNKFEKEIGTFGERLADGLTRVIGTWPFLTIQTIILLGWVALNVTAYVKRWDPYPFILLNLALSMQAAYAAPIILMSQNRQNKKDRLKAERDLETDRKAEREIEEIQEYLHRIENKKLTELKNMIEALERKTDNS